MERENVPASSVIHESVFIFVNNVHLHHVKRKMEKNYDTDTGKYRSSEFIVFNEWWLYVQGKKNLVTLIDS